VHGSAGLVQTRLRKDLVDVLRVVTYPVVVGEGERLFGDGTVPRAWRSVAPTAMPAGAVASVYEQDGEPWAGEFTLDGTPWPTGRRRASRTSGRRRARR
jgi:dihydrofolate reductase